MVHYSILTNDAPFTIERTNGTITTVRSLDRESVSSYELVVQAEDFAIQNPLTSTATVSCPQATLCTVQYYLAALIGHICLFGLFGDRQKSLLPVA